MPDETTDVETLASRLDTVERALIDDDRPAANAPSDTPAVDPDAPDRADLEASIAELDRRVSDLTAELDAVRGLLGGVRAVNESVERRADLALATAERLAASREAEDGLRVERLPGDDATGGEAAASDTAVSDAETGDFDAARGGPDHDGTDDGRGEGGDSLAARLREAL